MSTHLLTAYVAVRSLGLSAQDRLDRLRADERGEGVISAAIADDY